MSFVELLPSSLLVAMGYSATMLLTFAPPKTDYRRAMLVVAFVFFSLGIGIIQAVVLSLFPKLMGFQWYLLKHL
jgi:hypothetical protein